MRIENRKSETCGVRSPQDALRQDSPRERSRTSENQPGWQFNRQINISVLIQLILIASLIVGSWVNLQRQLDLLQHDVTMLIQSNREFQEKLESLWAKAIAYEYRLRAIEKRISKTDAADKAL